METTVLATPIFNPDQLANIVAALRQQIHDYTVQKVELEAVRDRCINGEMRRLNDVQTAVILDGLGLLESVLDDKIASTQAAIRQLEGSHE